MAKACVVLSGCGYIDGAEIQEAVLTLYFLEREGIEVSCFAPNVVQKDVVNHLTGEPVNETRNVLVESARIVRGAVADIAQADMSAFDALVIPGGFGVAKNFSDFATQGAKATVTEDFTRLVVDAVRAKKPVVAICITPAVVAAVLHKAGISATLTIGDDAGTADAINALGCTHQNAPVTTAIVDEQARIISTPAYMMGPGPKDVGAGIEEAIKRMAAML